MNFGSPDRYPRRFSYFFRTNGENRAGCLSKDLFRNTPMKEVLHSRPAVRCHENQISVELLSSLDGFPIRVSGPGFTGCFNLRKFLTADLFEFVSARVLVSQRAELQKNKRRK